MKFMAKCLSLYSIGTVTCVAVADTFYWNQTDAQIYNWSDSTNWQVDDGGTAVAASRAPGTGDTIKRKTGGNTTMRVDLGGADISIDKFEFATGNWNNDLLFFTNGTLRLTSGSSGFFLPAKIAITNASLISTAEIKFAHGNHSSSAAPMSVMIGAGGLLELGADYYMAKVGFEIGTNGVFRLTKTARGCNPNANVEIPFRVNGGTLDFPAGFKNFNSAWSYNPHIYMNDGLWVLGDEVKYQNNIRFYTELLGGTIQATNNVKFTLHSNAWGKFVDQANVTLDVSSGKMLDLNNFTFDGKSALTKTGAGTLKLSDIPSSLTVSAGTVDFVSRTTVAMDYLSLAVEEQDWSVTVPNTSIARLGAMKGEMTIAAKGLSIGQVDDLSLVTGSFTLDPNVFDGGDVVVTSESAGLLQLMETSLKAAGFSVTVKDDTLVLDAPEVVFNSTTSGDLNDPKNWKNGEVPPVGSDVTIAGEGVTAIVDGSIPLWNVKVADHATLRVTTDATVLGLALKSGATVDVIGGVFDVGEAVSFESAAVAAVVDVSVRVAAGATLKVPGGTKFKNCALDLKGTLLGDSDGPFVFGTADYGETAHFAMTADGATITAINDAKTEGAARIDFAVPTAGGEVVVENPIVLKNTTFSYNSKDGFAFGLDNPASSAIKVVADNTTFKIGSHTYIAGGANLVLSNNSVLVRERREEGDTASSMYNIYVRSRGKVTLVDGGEIRAGVTRVNNDTTNGVIELDPDEEDFVGIEVLEGGIGCWYKLNGKNKGTVRFAGGTMDVFKSYWWGWGNRNHMFNNLVAVEIAEGTTMTLRGIKDKLASNESRLTNFELESPFTGAGDLVITNAWEKNTGMEPHFIRADNTCTGTIRVTPCAAKTSVKAVFENGANWAGTVNGYNVGLVNKTAGAFATCAFGGLELGSDANFTMAFGEGGADKLVLGANGFTGSGNLTFKSTDAAPGEVVGVVASVLKTANALPKVVVQDVNGVTVRGYELKLVDDPDDETRQNVLLRKRKGLIFLIH